MSFKVVKSGCCVGRCALVCDSATRYIRLSSSRSQTHIHDVCMYACVCVHSHASWHCLRVRSGRKISDPELNRHYFQLTRKQSRLYTLLHTRTRTHTCTHTHTCRQAGVCGVYASVSSVCCKADLIWKFRITKCLSLYFMLQLHTGTCYAHTHPRSGQSLCLCEFCDWNSITCVLFAPKTKEKETKKDAKRQQKFWPLPGIAGVWVRVFVFLSFISGKCHLAAETETEPDPEAKTEQQQQQ